MSMSFDHEALWLKAKLFLNRAMDEDVFRSFDERAFWAAASLELLGKAALCKLSPVLIADPNSDGKNIMAAAGLGEPDRTFTSIRATTVFARCKRAFPPFDVNKAGRLAGSRNEYLHGGGIGFDGPSADKWWQDFWSSATILIDAQDRSIRDLVGEDREAVATEHLSRNQQYLEQRVESLISRAKQRYEMRRLGDLSEMQQRQWKTSSSLTANLAHYVGVPCPACGNEGVVEGEEVYNTRVEDVTDPWIEGGEYRGVGDVYSEHYYCEDCLLVLDDYELIELAGIQTSFEIEDEEILIAAQEGMYGND